MPTTIQARPSFAVLVFSRLLIGALVTTALAIIVGRTPAPARPGSPAASAAEQPR